MTRSSSNALKLLPALLLFAPLLGGARGDGEGCGGAINSRSPSPDMTGTWDVDYQDDIRWKLSIGGAVYDGQLSAAGGTISVDHEGQPLEFALDCTKPGIVCPSEVWPETVSARHKNPTFPHRFHVSIASQQCSGAMVAPAASECGEGTENPDCSDVCMGTVTERTTEHFGVVSEEGDRFDLLLGAGVATNGVNCGLLAVSAAHADLRSEGSAETGDWTAVEMNNGDVVVAYTGACLWAGDPDRDQQLEAIVLAASLEFRTGFTGNKQ